jgi:hypothetical protein
MRKHRIGPLSDDAFQVQDVHVDLPRAARERRRPAAAAFDVLDRLQKGSRRAAPENLGHDVPEPALGPMADGLG